MPTETHAAGGNAVWTTTFTGPQIIAQARVLLKNITAKVQEGSELNY